jgi:hypothetical protein
MTDIGFRDPRVRGFEGEQLIAVSYQLLANSRSHLLFSRRDLWHSEDVDLFSRVWQTFSCSQQYILRGVLVEQTLENKPTAGLGWNPFGDVIFQRTAMTFD